MFMNAHIKKSFCLWALLCATAGLLFGLARPSMAEPPSSNQQLSRRLQLQLKLRAQQNGLSEEALSHIEDLLRRFNIVDVLPEEKAIELARQWGVDFHQSALAEPQLAPWMLQSGPNGRAVGQGTATTHSLEELFKNPSPTLARQYMKMVALAFAVEPSLGKALKRRLTWMGVGAVAAIGIFVKAYQLDSEYYFDGGTNFLYWVAAPLLGVVGGGGLVTYFDGRRLVRKEYLRQLDGIFSGFFSGALGEASRGQATEILGESRFMSHRCEAALKSFVSAANNVAAEPEIRALPAPATPLDFGGSSQAEGEAVESSTRSSDSGSRGGER